MARAVEQAFLQRQADQTDGCRSLLVLTPTGRAHLEEIHRFRRTVFAEVMADWSDAERQEFARLLTKFVRRLDAMGS